MDRTYVLVPVCLLVVLAGCSLGPTGTPTASPAPPPDIEVSVANGANGTYDTEVLLLPRPAERARVFGTNGTSWVVGNLATVVGVKVHTPEEARTVRPLDVAPLATQMYEGIGEGSSVSSTFEDPPANAALFVVVADTGGVYLWATANCGEYDYLSEFDSELRDRESDVSVECISVGATAG